jgi:hypothetical protein
MKIISTLLTCVIDASPCSISVVSRTRRRGPGLTALTGGASTPHCCFRLTGLTLAVDLDKPRRCSLCIPFRNPAAVKQVEGGRLKCPASGCRILLSKKYITRHCTPIVFWLCVRPGTLLFGPSVAGAGSSSSPDLRSTRRRISCCDDSPSPARLFTGRKK